MIGRAAAPSGRCHPLPVILSINDVVYLLSTHN